MPMGFYKGYFKGILNVFMTRKSCPRFCVIDTTSRSDFFVHFKTSERDQQATSHFDLCDLEDFQIIPSNKANVLKFELTFSEDHILCESLT